MAASLPAWLDGALVDPTHPAVGLDDVGLRSGIGVFQTFLATGGTTGVGVVGLTAHLARLVDDAARLGLTADPLAARRAVREVLAAVPDDVGPGPLVVRITLTGGPLADASLWPPTPGTRPRLAVTLHHAPPPSDLPPTLDAVIVDLHRVPGDLKSTSYVTSVLATRQAREADAQVALLSDGERVLEGAEGDLFVVLPGANAHRLRTPPADGRILAGVTRARVLALGPTLTPADGTHDDDGRAVHLEQAPITRAELATASEAFVVSAVQGLRALRAIDGRTLPGAATSPVAHRVRAQLSASAVPERP
jgi:branched-subunit amino acid aminotransferase/4-amino-4-deoxychorismate lyase